ncbi:MAG: AraC family transcriptional regulator, partial [Verrucomicrobiota bacterium]
MDFSINHWSPYQRLHPSPFPLMGCAFVKNKDHEIRRAFNTCNFSLILRGRGEFRRAGKIWKVESPCVITQWPGEFVQYGPSVLETWSELYFIY